jgi:hypothetical protein
VVKWTPLGPTYSGEGEVVGEGEGEGGWRGRAGERSGEG